MRKWPSVDEEPRMGAMGRVGMWRGGCRSNISVAAPFVRRCLTGSAMAPFPHPAHRTGHADFPHPALGQDFTPSSRVTPSAVSEHFSELLGFPISRSLTACCVCLEPRPLPSTGITRLQRCRVGRGGAYRPASARSLKRLVQFSRKPLSYVGRTDWRRLVRIPGTRRISRTSPKSAMRRADGYRRQALFLHRLLTKDHSRRSIHPSSR